MRTLMGSTVLIVRQTVLCRRRRIVLRRGRGAWGPWRPEQGLFARVADAQQLGKAARCSALRLRDLANALREQRASLVSCVARSDVSEQQGVRHAHIHVIPRSKGDVPNPRGGVRGVIPFNASY